MDELMDSNTPEGRKRQRFRRVKQYVAELKAGTPNAAAMAATAADKKLAIAARKKAAKEVAERKAAAILRHPRDESEAPSRQHVKTLKVMRGPAAPRFGVLMAVALAMPMTLPTLASVRYAALTTDASVHVAALFPWSVRLAAKKKMETKDDAAVAREPVKE